MNPSEATDYLLDLELFGMRFGLDRMHRLMTALGMPQRRYASIHVVGTNGKSSTTRMIAAILERHGLRTGSYTSPHLKGYPERIEVGCARIADEDFAAAVTRVRSAAELVDRTVEPGDEVTQFEALTATAFHELARRRVEVAVVEAGLGGRYDATNVIPSRVQVLTGVALDHTRWLGPTITAIAEEKLAVVKDHAVLVTGELHPEAEAVAARVAAQRHARRVHAGDAPDVPLRAAGVAARRNFALASAAAGAFLGREPDAEALRAAANELTLPGRLEVVARDPLVIHDGAHNPDAAAALAQSLPALVGERRLVGVIGILDDKDAAAILAELLPLLSAVVFTSPANPRSLPPATLQSLAARIRDLPSEIVPDPRAAVSRAAELAGPEGAVLATGSLHLIADLVREDPSARASVL
jgi:dihydrofolate synthase/folylpolyglutamate synthase